jgi:hypothetical protein
MLLYRTNTNKRRERRETLHIGGVFFVSNYSFEWQYLPTTSNVKHSEGRIKYQ